jgi:hypothetical protein
MKLKHPVVVGASVVALGTFAAGWLVPVAWGVVVGIFWAGDRPGRKAAAASALAWALLLIAIAAAGFPIAVLASRLAGALGVPSPALVAVTVLFPAVLSGCAAVLAGELVTWTRRPRGIAAASR